MHCKIKGTAPKGVAIPGPGIPPTAPMVSTLVSDPAQLFVSSRLLLPPPGLGWMSLEEITA